MFNLFGRKKMSGKSASIEASNLFPAIEKETVTEPILPVLAIPVHSTIGKEDEYILKFLNNELEKMGGNLVNLSGISLTKVAEGIQVMAFFRNTIARPFTLNNMKLVLRDNKGRVIAKQAFSFDYLGKLQPNTSVPMTIVFPQEIIQLEDFETEGFTIQFDLLQAHKLIVEDPYTNLINEEIKKALETDIKEIGYSKEESIVFTPFQIHQKEDGTIHALLIISNYFMNAGKTLVKVPMIILDAKEDLVAEIAIEFKEMHLPANSSKLFLLTIPTSSVKNEGLDLRSLIFVLK